MERWTGTVFLPHGLEMRMDIYISGRAGILSRSQIKNRLLEAKVNGKKSRLSKMVRSGDNLEICWKSLCEESIEAENIPLDILYEDDRVIVINKRPGMVVHPGAGNPRGTLANAMKSLGAQARRAGIVHRLDKDTSGVIIAAWDEEALAFLAAQFKARMVKKRYAAIVHGIPHASGVIKARIIRDPRERKRFTVLGEEAGGVGAGKAALTRWRLVRSWTAGEGYSLLLVRPKTGRTHQIRVHLKSIGHPVAGDPLYVPMRRRDYFGACFPLAESLMLHAYSLEIVLPGLKEASVFKAPLPGRFRSFISLLERG